MSSTSIIPVILCGGTGTRLGLCLEKFQSNLYPLIRDNKSLLQKTQERLREIENIKNPILICNEDIVLLLLNK